MIVRTAMAPAATALALIAAPAHAGPCTDRIYQADLAVEKILDAAASNGKPAAQSTFATLHRQPTPGDGRERGTESRRPVLGPGRGDHGEAGRGA